MARRKKGAEVTGSSPPWSQISVCEIASCNSLLLVVAIFMELSTQLLAELVYIHELHLHSPCQDGKFHVVL
eukprot:759921-Hanusia_phi.AAC.2